MLEGTDVAVPTACDNSAGDFVFASATPAAPAVVTAGAAAPAPAPAGAAPPAAAAAGGGEEERFAGFDGDEGPLPSGSAATATAAAVVAVSVLLEPARGPKISRSFSILACSRWARTLARAASLLSRAAQRRRFTCYRSFVPQRIGSVRRCVFCRTCFQGTVLYGWCGRDNK